MATRPGNKHRGQKNAEKRADVHRTDGIAALFLPSEASYALLDPEGIVTEASSALRVRVPNAVGRSVVDIFGIGVPDLESVPSASKSEHGCYTDAAGDLVPTILQFRSGRSSVGDFTLLLVLDGAPFRHAENRRFEATPDPVLRIRRDGRVGFANGAAAALFGQASAGDLVGVGFASLFSLEAAPKIEAVLSDCVANATAESFEVGRAAANVVSTAMLRVTLMPDPAPDGRSLGVVAIVRSTHLERVRHEIKKVALSPVIPNWRDRLRLILREVASVVRFDHATYGIYAENARLFRAMLLEPKNDVVWPARWMELPTSIRDWLESGNTWIPDIAAFVRADATLRENEVVKEYEKRGIRSSVTVPISSAAGPTSALSLCSCAPGAYDKHDLDKLHALDLESVLLRLEADIMEERDKLSRELQSKLADAESLQMAGQEIVDRLGQYFEWDHISLFRVNRRAQTFELRYQYARTPDCEIEMPYVQPIDEGMLEATFREERVLIVDDAQSPHLERHGYRPVNSHLRSAMTAPVHLNGRVRWILNAESSVAYTFRGPDRDALENVIRMVEEGLEQRLLIEIKSSLLHETQQGVVVAGLEGSILEMNATAARLLGQHQLVPERPRDAVQLLQLYGEDAFSRAVLEGVEAPTGQRIHLRGDDRRLRTVLATCRKLDISFDTALWFLTDLEGREWSRELQFLRQTVADVAQETRGPLAIAATLTQRVRATLKRAEADGISLAGLPATIERLCERVAAEFGKVDITFERLAEGLSIVKEPVRSWDVVDLGECVNSVITLLPERDQLRIDWTPPNLQALVSGDRERLAFVFRSILAYLVRCAPGDAIPKVEVLVTSENRSVRVSLILPSHTPLAGDAIDLAGDEPTDALSAAVRAAREDARLGLAAVEHIVKGHRGVLSKYSSRSSQGDSFLPWTEFVINLPQSA